MAGENFKPDQALITSLEGAAAEKGAGFLRQTLREKHDVFFKQVDDVSKIDVAVFPDPAKTVLAEDMTKIHQLIQGAAEKGQQLLAQEDRLDCTPVAAIAAELRSVIQEMKESVPIYRAIAQAEANYEALAPHIRDTLAIKDLFQNTMTAKEKSETTAFVLEELYRAKNPLEPYNGLKTANPVLQKYFDDVTERIDSTIVKIVDLNIETLPDKKRGQPEIQALDSVRTGYDVLLQDASHAYALKSEVMQEVETAAADAIGVKMQAMTAAADEVLQKMSNLYKQLLAIPQNKLASEYRGYYEIMVGKIGEKIRDMANIKLYAATKEFTDWHRYLIFQADGTVKKAPEFENLPKEKQDDVLSQLEALRIKISLEMDEKLATPEEKDFIEGKKMLAAGNWIEAKKALQSFYKLQLAKADKEKNPHFGETKDLLKYITKIELLQATSRLMAMKESIEGRFDWATFGHQAYGALNKDQADMFIDDMARVLSKAREMVESGDVLSIEEAEAKLRSMKPKKSLKEDKFQASLSRFQKGFPTDYYGKKADVVFDVFQQQKLLNEPDKEKRQHNLWELVQQARKQGLTEVAKQYCDLFFEKELSEKAKKFDKVDTYQKFVSDPDNMAKIDEQLAHWGEKYKSEHGAAPNGLQLAEMRKFMVDSMVTTEHNRKIRIAVHKDFEGQNWDMGAYWNQVYGGNLVLEDLGGGLLSDDDWNALPAKTAIGSSIVMIATATGGAAATALTELGAMGTLSTAMGMAEMGTLTEGVVAAGSLETFLGTATGKAALFGLETGVFTLTEESLHGVILQDWSAFQSGSAFLRSWGQTALIYAAHGAIERLAGVKGIAAVKDGDFMPKKLTEVAAEKAIKVTGKKALKFGVISGINTGAAWLTEGEFKTSHAVKAHGNAVIFTVF